MRIRSVKPDYWQDEKILSCSRDARLLYVALWNEADDDGRFRSNHKLLHGHLFPCDPGDWFDSAMSELLNLGRVVEYEVDGQHYGFIPTFRKHQKINHPTESRLPPPPTTSVTGELRENSGTSPVDIPFGAGSWELGAGSREQGTGSREHICEVATQTHSATESHSATQRCQFGHLKVPVCVVPKKQIGQDSEDGSPSSEDGGGELVLSVQEQESPRRRGKRSKAQKPNGQVESVFEYWRSTCGHPRAKLDEKRRRRIEWAIKNYGVEKSQQAIYGCSQSEFHQGKNDAGKIYDDLELIFRDAKRVEQFLERYESATGDGAVGSPSFEDEF